MISPKIENVVFCDAIRQETGGKHLLIGAFAPELSIETMPSTVFLGIWMSVVPAETGDIEAKIRLKRPDGSEDIIWEINGNIQSLSKAAIVVPKLAILVTMPGSYKFSINFNNKKWQNLETLVFKIAAAKT